MAVLSTQRSQVPCGLADTASKGAHQPNNFHDFNGTETYVEMDTCLCRAAMRAFKGDHLRLMHID